MDTRDNICRIRSLSFGLIVAIISGRASCQINVTTYKYDSARRGANSQETILTPASVSGPAFHKVFTTPLDGYVYAQPLYMSALRGIAGGASGQPYNVVFVATEHDSIYALNADSNNPAGDILWHHTYLGAGEAPVYASGDASTNPDLNCGDLVPEIGITSTPVIDQETLTLYFVTKAKGSDGSFRQRLHAVSLLDGTEKFGGSVLISGQASGTQFDPRRQFNRAALLLDGGNVVIAWASHCDAGPFHGWVMSYDAATLKQKGVFITTPNGSEGGIWMSGGGLAADSQHRLFFATGNGDYDGAANGNYSDSIVRLDVQSDGTFKVGDWFTPWNQGDLNTNDTDLGAGGLLLLPDLPIGSPHPHLLVQMGKNGTVYLVDQDSMGKYCDGCPQDSQIVQTIPKALKGMWGTPAYWNGFIYWVAGRPAVGAWRDVFRVWRFNASGSGMISTAPSSQAIDIFKYSTAAPVVSANGNMNGVVWILDNSLFNSAQPGPQVLYAYDATDLTKRLYSSNQALAGKDQPGGAVKFGAPIVANGRVYAGGARSISAWGLVPMAAKRLLRAPILMKQGGRDH